MRPRTVRRPVPRSQQSPEATSRRHRPDYWLVMLCAAMVGIGLVVVYSISPALSAASGVSNGHYINKQLIAIGFALVAFLATSQIPLPIWRKFVKPMLVVAALATFIALLMPVNPDYPAHRWVRLGSFSFQSVEIVKFAMLFALAGFLAARAKADKLDDFKATLRPLIIALVVVGLFIAGPQSIRAQSDLGSMGVMIAMFGTMCFVAGVNMKRLLLIGGLIAILAALVILPSAYRRERVATFLHPAANCQDAGYQACQALIAVGSGGLTGLGLGKGVQAYGYLPQAANDSIFAIFAEKFGFLGTVALLALLLTFFSRMKSIVERAPDDFSRLLVSGVLAWLSIQSLINIGAMIGVLPLKGITLPFISYGGTSIVFVAAAVGLVFQVSRYTVHTVPRVSNELQTKKGKSYDNSRDGRRLRGAYHPDLGSRL
jgi:cell division protein FtsW